MRVRGVLVLFGDAQPVPTDPDDRRLIDALCSSIAMALERVHYVGVAQHTLVRIEGERLRNALLAAVSHDLKTPLTAIRGARRDTGAARAARRRAAGRARARHPQPGRGAARGRREPARPRAHAERGRAAESRMAHARRDRRQRARAFGRRAGRPRREHRLAGRPAADRRRRAADRARADEPARQRGEVRGHGRGRGGAGARVRRNAVRLRRGRRPRFHRAQHRAAVRAVRARTQGIVDQRRSQLALCRSIVNAHGGSIRAVPLDPHGARFEIRLPLGAPPDIEHESRT